MIIERVNNFVFRVVLDTNILVSAIIFGGQPRKILDLALKNEKQFFISREIITETIGILRKKLGFQKEALAEVEELLIKTFVLVEPRQTVKIIKNQPADNRILESGLEAKAGVIVSGDKRHLLSLATYRGIKIISAKGFLKIYG